MSMFNDAIYITNGCRVTTLVDPGLPHDETRELQNLLEKLASKGHFIQAAAVPGGVDPCRAPDFNGACDHLLKQYRAMTDKKEGLQTFEIWIPGCGYSPDDHGAPVKLGNAQGVTFRDACHAFMFANVAWSKDYNSEQLTWDGAMLYSTAVAAGEDFR